MKNIFTTIEYVAEKIKEAITGHKNDEQAHPNLSEQINVLSTNKAEKKYVDEQDLKSMNYKALIDNTRLYMTTQTGIYLTPASGVTDLPDGWAQGRHTLVCFNPNNDLYGFQLITTYAGSSGIGNNRKFAIRHAITEGSKWLELANTEKTDILQCLTGGWTVVSDCIFSAQKIGNRIFIEGIIQNSSPGQKTIAVGLPIPSDRKWHGGLGVGSNNEAVYMVVDPTGTLSFQYGGYTQGVTYSISIDYPV